uniref:Uncharacterized protein n=1 Tax=Fagus sylvatica TaxID=28930 RepID=A0A2N9HTZ8_FAGSY
MKSSAERINIAASTQKLDVDNRISLRYYYRIADNILKQTILSGKVNLNEDEDDIWVSSASGCLKEIIVMKSYWRAMW